MWGRNVSMFDIIRQGSNAMQAFDLAMKLNATNLGQASTVGYKALSYNFQSVFSQVLNPGSEGSMVHGGTSPIQTGAGVTLSSVNYNFSQGELGAGTQYDLAISGNGFFMVSPDEGVTFYYTRAGKFHFDNNGTLKDESGNSVYGFDYQQSSHGDYSQLLPIIVTNPNECGWQHKGTDGILVANYAVSEYDPDSLREAEPLYQIAITDFPNKQGLTSVNATTYKASTSTGIAYHHQFLAKMVWVWLYRELLKNLMFLL